MRVSNRSTIRTSVNTKWSYTLHAQDDEGNFDTHRGFLGKLSSLLVFHLSFVGTVDLLKADLKRRQLDDLDQYTFLLRK